MTSSHSAGDGQAIGQNLNVVTPRLTWRQGDIRALGQEEADTGLPRGNAAGLGSKHQIGGVPRQAGSAGAGLKLAKLWRGLKPEAGAVVGACWHGPDVSGVTIARELDCVPLRRGGSISQAGGIERQAEPRLLPRKLAGERQTVLIGGLNHRWHKEPFLLPKAFPVSYRPTVR